MPKLKKEKISSVKRLLLGFPLGVFFLLILLSFCSCEKKETLGMEALEIGDFVRAEKFFSEILDENPKCRNARYGSALAKYGLAEEQERSGIVSVKAWLRSANEFRILWRMDSSASVRSVYSNCLFYLARAVLHESLEADVSDLLQRSIFLDSTNYFSYNLKALLLESQGNFKAAEETFIYLLSRFPNFENGYINFGNFYWNQGLYGDAWDIWSMGLERFPKNSELLDWKILAEQKLSEQHRN